MRANVANITNIAASGETASPDGEIQENVNRFVSRVGYTRQTSSYPLQHDGQQSVHVAEYSQLNRYGDAG